MTKLFLFTKVTPMHCVNLTHMFLFSFNLQKNDLTNMKNLLTFDFKVILPFF